MNGTQDSTTNALVPANDGTGKLEILLPEPIPTSQLILLGVVQLDPWLEPFKDALRTRYSKAESWIKTINETEGGLDKFSKVGSLTRRRGMPKLTPPGNREVWIQRGQPEQHYL